MNTFKFFLFCFFLSFAFTLCTFAQTAQFEQPFIFSDEFNNTQELIIGYDPFGTNGLDPDLGEIIIPQVPPGEFGVRFQLPPDTSITTIKDIRFGCPWPGYYEHLIDLSYTISSTTIEINWSWTTSLVRILEFINPQNGEILATLENSLDPPHFSIPSSLSKIRIDVFYSVPLSWPEYRLYAPNGGEIIEGGTTFEITWWYNQLGSYFGNIAFSSDSGNSWSIVEDTILSTQNSYDWNVPNINSDGCLIRVGDYPCAYDKSDSFFTITTQVSIEDEESVPTEFSLFQNYPNPFNPSTIIRFTIPTVERFAESLNNNERIGNSLYNVLLKVYDVLGNEIASLVNEEKPPGSYEVEFDGTGLPSGIYFYQLKTGSFFETKKMVLAK